MNIPENVPTGVAARLPRRIVWKLMRPYFDSMVRQLAEENATLRSDLVATNYRISALEERLDARV